MTNARELDNRLRDFIKEPENFLAGIALVNALHKNPVWASVQQYAIDLEGQLVTPVFTNKSDLENFKREYKGAKEQRWVQRPSFEVLMGVIHGGSAGLAYNLKTSGDFENSTIFPKDEFVQFLNHYTTIMNQIMGEDNLKADVMDKYYLVPVFITPNGSSSYERSFPTLSTSEGHQYVPVFSNLRSFARWYNRKNFGVTFRNAHGSVLVWKLEEIYQSGHGDRAIDETRGIAINALDDQQILVDWSAMGD